jgi:CoA-transferase family III
VSTTATREPAVSVARRAATELCEVLDLPLLVPARPGSVGWLPRPRLLRAADGWVHPGPPTAWDDFAVMLESIGGDLSALSAEAVDAEAGAWRLPAVAVRSAPARAPVVRWPRPGAQPRRDVVGARVVVLGSTWAAPLTGRVLAELGANVVRVMHPRRLDPFPIHDELLVGQATRALDLDVPENRDRFAALLDGANLLVDGTTPRVLANVGLGDRAAATVAIAAFAHEDRPGYGIAAECRGGWAARYDPPRLGRVSVADPIAGLLAALVALNVLSTGGARPVRERVALEDAVGHLFEVEASRG